MARCIWCHHEVILKRTNKPDYEMGTIYSAAGIKEFNITQTCESCFDHHMTAFDEEDHKNWPLKCSRENCNACLFNDLVKIYNDGGRDEALNRASSELPDDMFLMLIDTVN